MSTRRLAATAGAMAGIAWLLAALGPGLPVLRDSLADAQRLADAAGPDALVTAWVAALAWLVWAWGVLGLGLTAATALPGLLGGAARALLGVVLPAGARRAAALTIGIGVGVGLGAPVATAAPPAPATAVPDWPSADEPAPPTAPAPDWPSSPDAHVVVPGDCLWDLAESRLAAASGRPPTDAEIAAAVPAWWHANEAVIGPDPDLLLPGQVLRPPGAA